MMQIKYDFELQQQLVRTSGLLLLNIWADWSLQCRNMHEVMLKIRDTLDDEDAIAFIDWQSYQGLANSLDVYGVPTLIIYAGGREVSRFSGIMSMLVLRQHIGAEKKACHPNNDHSIQTK